MEPIIHIKGIGKKYRITRRRGGYVALRDVLTGIVKSPLRYLRQKASAASGMGGREEFWALRNVSLQIQKGEIIGVIGANGAGKSTLLKILTGITPPTEGEIVMRGRVVSLLEVGTGFHPELSGRENILLNGAILGMTKKEIADRFDAIVAFAGVETFLDTPVKYYSSGMYVRLAFSVAAHMEPDILLVDEVLAVGDAEFQKKCLGKMEDVTKASGRTILFVSHSMGAIQSLCTKTLWLERGQVKAFGETRDIIERYLQRGEARAEAGTGFSPDLTKDVAFTNAWIAGQDGRRTSHVNVDQSFSIWLEFATSRDLEAVEISLGLKNGGGTNITFTSLSDSFGGKTPFLKKGVHRVSATIPGNFLMPDQYFVRISAHERGVRDIDLYEDALRFTVIETGSVLAKYGKAARGLALVLSRAEWRIEKV